MIVPGSANPLLMAQAGDPLDELGVIAKSLRFRAAANAYLTKTFAASNRKTWTLNWWAKFSRSVPSASEVLIENYDLGANHFGVFKSNDSIRVYWAIGGSVLLDLITSRVFRDVASHANLHVRIDTTQAVAADRARLYCNGKQVTTFTTAVYPAQNSDMYFNAAGTYNMGRGSAGNQYFDGYMSNMAFVDGQSVGPESFAQFHPRTGQWRPKSKAAVKAVVDAGGVNSFFLPFDDATSITTLCADASSKGNSWTGNNISLTAGAAYDLMFDTATNNFCTLNPLLPINILTGGYYPILPTDGALKITGSSAPLANFQNGTQQIKFKAYYEMLVGSVGAGTFYIGVQNISTGSVYCYQQDGAKNIAGTTSAYGAAFTAGDRVAVTADPVSRSLEFFKQTGGSGAFVSQGVIATAFPAGEYVPFFYASNGTVLTVNFGQQGFVNPSFPSDAKALCTKKLGYPPIPKPSSAFAAIIDTGSTIAATLAAEASWSDWIRIYKRRDAAEGWRWQFSDDQANYLDSSSTEAKAAFPALSGSYVGYALKVSQVNGVATGRLTHINGVADVVVDGLVNSRKVVMLRGEAGGNWFVYHPDLTAGKLMYLNSRAAETTDATINSVTDSGFSVAAALASGVYRWVSIADVEGFLKVGYYSNNTSADGSFAACGSSTAFSLIKYRAAGTTDWMAYDSARDADNPNDAHLRMNLSASEVIGAAMDMVSNGIKVRSVGTTANQINYTIGAERHCFLQIAVSPFRYANAR